MSVRITLSYTSADVGYRSDKDFTAGLTSAVVKNVQNFLKFDIFKSFITCNSFIFIMYLDGYHYNRLETSIKIVK